MLTDRVALRQMQNQGRDKRGGGDVRGDSALAVAEPVAGVPTPLEEAAMQENMARS